MDSKITPRKIGQSILWAVWTCSVFLLVQAILSLVLSWFIKITSIHITSALAQTIFSLLAYSISIVIIIVLPKYLSKLWHEKHPKSKLPDFTIKKSDLGLNELPTWTDIGLAPAGLIVYAMFAALLTSLFSLFPWFNISENQDVGFNTLVLTSDRIFAFITLVVIAPIAEELIFRGFLYKKIKDLFFKKEDRKTVRQAKRKTPKKQELIAIAISTFITSLAFGIMHGQWNIGVNVFAMSVILCIMREITGSIYSGILLHMLKNAIAFYLLYVVTLGF